MLFKLLLLLSLCLSPLSAQIDIFPDSSGSSDTHTESTVAGLPGAPASGTVRIVTDGNAAGDCTTGGGSNRVLCEYTGSGWAPLGDGNSGGAPAFSSITTGTNTGATMTVGTGATITISGSGVNNANQYKGNSVVAEADIHADIARDSEVTSEIATHAAVADAHHTATVQRTQEEIEDFAGALIENVTGTHTGITVTYQDATGDVDLDIDHDAATNFVADEHVAHSGITITAGAGLGGGGTIDGNVTLTTASGEANFLTSGALTCGAGTQGSAQVHTTPLQYCDNAATPALQYAAYGDSAGNAAGVQANSVALGTDTTGNYAGSSSEGGAATTALALDANPAALTAGNYCSDLNADGTCASETDATTEIDSAISTHAGDSAAHHAAALLLTGGTMTAEFTADDLGIEFTAGDAITDCSTFAATGGGIFYDDSEGVLKKCQDNVLSVLDTTGGTPTFTDISTGTNTTATMTVGTGASIVASGSGAITATGVTANSVALGTDTTGNYAGSSSEGGAATTAAALSANPASTTGNYCADRNADGSCAAQEDLDDLGGTVSSAQVEAHTRSIWFGPALSADGTNCADPTEVTIGSWGKQFSFICTDNDASILTGSVRMPDGWDAGTVTFELSYIQDAADTSALNADVAARCVGDTETPAAYGTEVAIDDAAVTGSDALDATTSGAVTAAGTCAAGDYLQFQVAIDATGTTTAMATLNILGVKMEYTTVLTD